MAKLNRWQKAIVVLSQGGVFSAEKLCKEMEYDCTYRIPNVLLDTRLFAGAVIKSIRDGRKVVGYELINVDEMRQLISSGAFDSKATAKPAAAPKPAKVKTTAKVAAVKPAKVTKPAKIKQDPIVEVRDTAPLSKAGVVDVFDEIDGSVESFEDQQFAEDFVRGL
jgi:hypothetical protein